MKEYKIVYLNKGIKLNRDRDIEQAEDILNEYTRSVWLSNNLCLPMMEWAFSMHSCIRKKCSSKKRKKSYE